jgi:hypothetical protein
MPVNGFIRRCDLSTSRLPHLRTEAGKYRKRRRARRTAREAGDGSMTDQLPFAAPIQQPVIKGVILSRSFKSSGEEENKKVTFQVSCKFQTT